MRFVRKLSLKTNDVSSRVEQSPDLDWIVQKKNQHSISKIFMTSKTSQVVSKCFPPEKHYKMNP